MVYDFSDCGGCTTCQIACSFKHCNAFQPEKASIVIQGNEDGVGFRVEIIDREDGEHFVCDGCRDLPDGGMPFCIRYCHKREDLQEIIEKHCMTMEGKRWTVHTAEKHLEST